MLSPFRGNLGVLIGFMIMMSGAAAYDRLGSLAVIENSEPKFRKGSMLSKKGLRDGLNDDSC